MTSLHFDPAAVAKLVQATKSATTRRSSLADLADPALWKEGARPDEYGLVTSADIDTAKIGPKLWLIKDEGCYLMSNAADQVRDADGRLPCVYAKGLGPDCDYQDLREACGGDDFCEPLPISDFEAALAGNPIEIVIELTPDTIAIKSLHQRP